MKAIQKQIDEYLAYCQNVRRMSEVTIKTKCYILTRFASETGLKDLRKLTNQIFDEYIAHLMENEISGRSINTYVVAIAAFVKYYKELGVAIPFKPFLVQKFKEQKTERKFYTAEEIARVIKEASPDTGLMIRIMFETGMRINELTKLRIMNFSGQKIQFIGKGRKQREVYISPETLDRVENYILANNIRDYLWGATLNGDPPTSHTIRRKLQRAFNEAGFEGFYPHALRHSFATNLQLKGASVAEIKEMMGHSNVATTEKYLHGFEGKMRELFEKYS